MNKEIVIRELKIALTGLSQLKVSDIACKVALSRLRFCIEHLKSNGKDTVRLKKENSSV